MRGESGRWKAMGPAKAVMLYHPSIPTRETMHMARRGFFAELARIARQSAREQERAHRAAVRARDAAIRKAEQTRRADERAQAALARADDAERKRLEKEAREAHVDAMEAEVDERNYALAEVYASIDSLLADTLMVDDYVDIETLRVRAEHPPFDRTDLELPTPLPLRVPDPPQPNFVAPAPPRGLGKLFGKAKHAKAIAQAESMHKHAMREWMAECDRRQAQYHVELAEHAATEANRESMLASERSRFEAECAARETAAAERNAQLDQLATNLSYGVPSAVQEYVSVVLSNSVYPPHFPVSHEFEFDAATAELRLAVLVPAPDALPTAKAYKYTKATDQIVETQLSGKACRDRYESAVHQVALRSIHEVFEADRRGIVKSIALKVGTDAVDPATGKQGYVPLVVVAAARETFSTFNLTAVQPELTLERLGASLSKNPFGLVPASVAGARRS